MGGAVREAPGSAAGVSRGAVPGPFGAAYGVVFRYFFRGRVPDRDRDGIHRTATRRFP